MVLRKPYAFLIKHFRIIHLLLLLPMFYLVFKTKEITTFFSQFVASGHSLNFVTITSSLSSNYINILMYVAVIIVLVVLVFISLLLQNKNKPTKFYNITIFYYLGLFILITFSFSIFNMIEEGAISTVSARIIRDLAYLIHYSQYVFIAFMIVRGIGFDIKKFDFKSDLTTLDISKEDDEEFEFFIGADTYKAKRTIRRFIREMVYYYKENKFICNTILVILICIFLTIIYTHREVYDKVYKENEILSFGSVTVKVKDSFISSLSHNGIALKDNKAYLILQVEIQNRYREDKTFNYSNFQLYVNKKYFSPDITMANYFLDYGNPYNGGLIKGNSLTSYVLVYEIDKNLANKKMNILVYSRYDTTPGGLGAVLKTIDISPASVNDKVTTNRVGKGTNINLKSTELKDTTATIIDYELTNRYQYNFKYCPSANNCYDSVSSVQISGREMGRYTLLVMDYDLQLDDKSSYLYSDKNYKSFFEDFMKIKYVVNGNEYTVDVKSVNPANYDDKLIVKVPTNINSATDIESIITVRNVSYSVKLK